MEKRHPHLNAQTKLVYASCRLFAFEFPEEAGHFACVAGRSCLVYLIDQGVFIAVNQDLMHTLEMP